MHGHDHPVPPQRLPHVDRSTVAVRERFVLIEQSIPGVLALPQSDTGPVAGVLLLHGFASDKNKVGNMYLRLAAELAERGMASLRIDFRGSGDSRDDFSTLTVANQVDDARRAFAFLRATPEVDAQRLGLLGFSLGGGIAILLASLQPDWVGSVATWSSVGDFEADFVESLGSEVFDIAKRDGQVTVNLGFREVTLVAPFFTSLAGHDLTPDISRLNCPVLFAYGAKDPLSAHRDRFCRASCGPLTELLLLRDADHIFRALSDDAGDAAAVIAATASWFVRMLMPPQIGV